LVASWLARNGYGGCDQAFSSFAVRFSATGGTPAGRWRAVVNSIPAWHERLRNVTILNRDCFEVISRIDDAVGTVVYVDPPYLVEGNRYDHPFTWDDHCRLQLLLRRFSRARVLVSYFADRRLDDLYAGWTLLPMVAPKFLVKAGQRQASGDVPTAPEVLLMNGPSLAASGGLFGE
jgi:DNA adenine methylase